ncbi:MAG: DegT/DnrJ/EryC1/StrS family aminotransferase [Opitutales bacterium]
MKIPFVDLHAQYLSIKGEIDEAIESVIKNSAFIRGEHVSVFEENYANKQGSKYCISCANGTDALYIAMKSLGIKPGDEVITTAHSWISTSETITQAGGKVVFVDTEADYFTVDPNKIEEKITPNTVGIIPVHLYGQMANIDKIQSIAEKHNLWLIEDCAQSHFATFENQKAGSFGDLATFSFYPGKNLGAMGDAGCITTNRDDIAEFAYLYARHGGKGDHVMEGINSRMDGLQAAILNVKLPYIDQWIKNRQKAAAKYSELLQHSPSIQLPAIRNGATHVYHLYVIKSEQRDELRKNLSTKGIATVVNYPKALPFYKAYDYLNHQSSDFPEANYNQKRILSLPIFPEISTEQIEYISNAIYEFTEI